jgi:hypothetical protein
MNLKDMVIGMDMNKYPISTKIQKYKHYTLICLTFEVL